MASNKQTKSALNSMKMQAASEVGVPLNSNGYNGELTAKQAGSMIASYTQQNSAQ